MNTLDPKIREGLERIRDKAREEKMLLPFPNWPDDRRAAPNDMLRSSLFGVVKRGRRMMLNDFELSAPPGWKLFYTGMRLDQIDLDIWLEIMHKCRTIIPGAEVHFTMRSVLRALGHCDGASAYAFLEKRLKSMTFGGFSFKSEDGKHYGATGTLFRKFYISESTGEGVVKTNEDLRIIYDNITYLNFADRLALGSQLSKWLHAVISSHVQWMPTKVETLMKQSGASYAELRWFRADLRTALDDLKNRQLIRSWSINTADLVHIAKDKTPAQYRHLAACYTN